MLLIFWKFFIFFYFFFGGGGGKEGGGICAMCVSDEGFSFTFSFGGFFSSECLPKSVLCRVCCAEVTYS